MHIPDGLVAGPINIASAVAALGVVGVSTWRATREVEREPQTMPLLATTAAFVFAAQMLNFPIGAGTSGHFLGAVAVAALLGPWRACLVMTLVLLLQTLVFNDGGLSALGTNIFNMAVVAGLGGYALMRMVRSFLPVGRAGYLGAVAMASWASVVLAAVTCALELAWSGVSPLAWVMPALAGTHAVIGVGEALITTSVLSAVLVTRPDMIPAWAQLGPDAAKPVASSPQTLWRLVTVGLLSALCLAFFVSPWASGAPDGLERVAEDQGFAQLGEGPGLWRAALLPDYSVPGVEDERMSTGLSGLLGTAAVFALGFCAMKVVCRRRESGSTVP